VPDALLEITDAQKAFGGLRPLRIEHLHVAPGESVAVLGLDALTSEVFVHLLMGATLPDSGRVAVFGRSTDSIVDSTEWLAFADRFGVVSHRGVLLDRFSVLQNLAVPFSLDVETLAANLRTRASELAREVRLPESVWQAPVGALPAEERVLVHLGRALAHAPDLLVIEHATAQVPPEKQRTIGHLIRALASRRGTAMLALTGDRDFAEAVSGRVLLHDPRTGRLSRARAGGWSVFRHRRST
jgi:putative ABC transport system ATP-binding protein